MTTDDTQCLDFRKMDLVTGKSLRNVAISRSYLIMKVKTEAL